VLSRRLALVAVAAMLLAGCADPGAAADPPPSGPPGPGQAIVAVGGERFGLTVSDCDDEVRRIDPGAEFALAGELRFAATAEGTGGDGEALLLEITRIALDEDELFDHVRLTEGDRVEPDRAWESYAGAGFGPEGNLTVTVEPPAVRAEGWFTEQAADAGEGAEDQQVSGTIELVCPA
jgi:hypothetical protein